MQGDHRLTKPISTEDGSTADAVIVNDWGVWLAEWDPQTEWAMHLVDANNDYIPAPSNWKELVRR